MLLMYLIEVNFKFYKVILYKYKGKIIFFFIEVVIYYFLKFGFLLNFDNVRI